MTDQEQAPLSNQEPDEQAVQSADTDVRYDHLLNAGPTAESQYPTGMDGVQPPLTDADVAKLEAHRGQPVTPDQRKYMDMARARGIHHSVV